MYNPFYEFLPPPDDCHTSPLKHVAVNIMNTVFDIHSVVLLRLCFRQRNYNVTRYPIRVQVLFIFIYLFITKIVVYKF